MNEPVSSWPSLVIDGVLQQRLADALHDAAMQLAVDQHRIDDGAEVVDRGVLHDLDVAGVGIDLDLADVAAVRDRPTARLR